LTFERSPLEIHEIAQIKSLLPDLIRFAYIDKDLLQVHAVGDDSEKLRKQQERDNLFVIRKPGEPDGPSIARSTTSQTGEEQVLVFEFNDGELKGKGGKVVHKKFA
jgi:DEAD/DEAH box helicase domain-containing protein